MTTTAPGPPRAPHADPHGRTERYLAVRARTEDLAAPLSPEDQTVQSMPEVSPTTWHRAHVSWFFETFLLADHLPGYREFHPAYRYLFNSYYETVGARQPRPQRGVISRPGVGEVTHYRRHVDEHMLRLLAGPLSAHAAGLVELGLQHEQQHQELLLSDIKHVLSQNPLDPPYLEAEYAATRRPAPTDTRPVGWIAHEGGPAQIGHRADAADAADAAGDAGDAGDAGAGVADAGDGFAYDNEGPAHTVQLVPFALADRLVTCGQWREFIADGGYRRPELWLSDGWATVRAEDWTAPLYWRQEGTGGGSGAGDWSVFTLTGRRPLDPAEPVCHVSYYEADAFARWADARLPTEAEWEVIAASRPVEGRFCDPADPHPRPQPRPSLYGDAWVWTASAYQPYPGFRPAPGAVGEYNGKFMVNQQVLRGGACVTPHGHLRASYRNFFPPNARWPFTGLRLARDR